MQPVNVGFKRLKLKGLKEDTCYKVSGYAYDCYGDELMNLGLITSDTSAGEIVGEDMPCGDYDSRLYVLKAE